MNISNSIARNTDIILHTPLIFLSHGKTDWNKQNIAMGQQYIPFNETGLRQAHKAAELLKNVSIGSIISNTLKRTKQTAGIISSHLDIGYQTDHDIRGIH
jgi:broad specificity phosphatase PhoE